MFRIRFHGRGGQGMKTASRMLGTAFFIEGYEVQDASRYGAERRGAPMFSYVRADTSPIFERGVIPNPDLVLVADDTLMGISAAGVTQGLNSHAVLAVNSFEDASVWQQRLNCEAKVISLPGFSAEDPTLHQYVGAVLAGSAARMLGLSKDSIAEAVSRELQDHGAEVVSTNVERALAAFDAMGEHEGIIRQQTGEGEAGDPGWIRLRREDVDRSAPAIHAGATSVQTKTGLWRTLRPVIDKDLCKRCNWICGSLCPDGAISVDADGYPVIDYDHCKGCLICLAQCPPHAINAVAEKGGAA